MSTRYLEVQQLLRHSPRRWVVSGVAGFIGSNILETLLKLDPDGHAAIEWAEKKPKTK